MSATKKILNDPYEVAADMLAGLIEAYDGEVVKAGTASLVKTNIPDGKVALLVGGGSGHEPIYHGLVGANLADGAACGDVFAAPPPNVILECAQAVNRGKGILFVYGNYAGDVLNFNLAAEMAAAEGIEVQTVLVRDDISSAPPDKKEDRRGIAGLVIIVKLAGAASQRAKTLDELVRITTLACNNTRSIGVAMKPGSIPATGVPTFELPDDEIEFGMGAHGEQGAERIKMTTADTLVPIMMDKLLADDLELNAGDEIVLLINSLGVTTMTELLIVNKEAKKILRGKGIVVHDTIVGHKLTCQEMAGFSITLTKLDAELKQYWDMPCESIAYSKM
jgi:dihydroxyacetone kinase-like protein|tara:strand:+ start:677 stop:1681 length:1005 start_codon:yes stop_codon:yes gene_type:complete